MTFFYHRSWYPCEDAEKKKSKKYYLLPSDFEKHVLPLDYKFFKYLGFFTSILIEPHHHHCNSPSSCSDVLSTNPNLPSVPTTSKLHFHWLFTSTHLIVVVVVVVVVVDSVIPSSPLPLIGLQVNHISPFSRCRIVSSSPSAVPLMSLREIRSERRAFPKLSSPSSNYLLRQQTLPSSKIISPTPFKLRLQSVRVQKNLDEQSISEDEDTFDRMPHLSDYDDDDDDDDDYNEGSSSRYSSPP